MSPGVVGVGVGVGVGVAVGVGVGCSVTSEPSKQSSPQPGKVLYEEICWSPDGLSSPL